MLDLKKKNCINRQHPKHSKLMYKVSQVQLIHIKLRSGQENMTTFPFHMMLTKPSAIHYWPRWAQMNNTQKTSTVTQHIRNRRVFSKHSTGKEEKLTLGHPFVLVNPHWSLEHTPMPWEVHQCHCGPGCVKGPPPLPPLHPPPLHTPRQHLSLGESSRVRSEGA